MVRPTTGRSWRRSTAATVEESTPPDIATATRPGLPSAAMGRESSWSPVFIFLQLIKFTGNFSLVRGGFLAIGGREFAQLRDRRRNYFQGGVDLGFAGVAPQAETDAGPRIGR